MEWLMIAWAVGFLCLAYGVFAVPVALLLWILGKRLRPRAGSFAWPRHIALKTVGIGFCVFMVSMALVIGVRALLDAYVLPTTAMYPMRVHIYRQGKMNFTQSSIFEYCESREEEHAYDLMRVGALAPTSPTFDVFEKSYSDCVNRWPLRLELLLLYGPVCLFVILRTRSIYRRDQGAPKSESRVGVWLVRLVAISGLAATLAIVVGMGYFPTMLKLSAEQYTRQNAVKPLAKVRSPAPSVGATAVSTAPPQPKQQQSLEERQAASPQATNIPFTQQVGQDVAARLKPITETLQRPYTLLPEVPIPERLWEDLGVTPNREQMKESANALMLSGGQLPELLVEGLDHDFCGSGSGCPWSIYGLRGQGTKDGRVSLKYRALLKDQGGVYVLTRATNGYRDLLIDGGYGGSVLKFNGTSYVVTECFSHDYKKLDVVQLTNCP